MKMSEAFADWGFWDSLSPLQVVWVDLLFLLLIVALVDIALGKMIRGFVTRLVKRTKAQWDDVLLENKVFARLAHIVSALILQHYVPVIFQDYTGEMVLFARLVEGYIIFIFLRVIIAITDVFEHYVRSLPNLKDKPVGSYFQLIKIVVYFFGLVFIVARILDKDPFAIIATFGALTAIVILVFKDTILGFVASVQIASNDLVRIDDWITVPKYGADGNVIDVNLHTVKVLNFDKTVTTIPTYSLVSDSFKNWRFMQESKTRRIKRAITLNPLSVRYCSDSMLDRLEKIDILKHFVQERRQEVAEYNAQHVDHLDVPINGRRLTNIGLFRFYLEAYLRNSENIDQESIMMVLQKTQTEQGIPVEVYCFANTPVWVDFEKIQADLFDHVFAAASLFELEVFQVPSSQDMQRVAKAIERPQLAKGKERG